MLLSAICQTKALVGFNLSVEAEIAKAAIIYSKYISINTMEHVLKAICIKQSPV